MRKRTSGVVVVMLLAGLSGGCSVTFQEARARLDSALASARQWSALGTRAICENYPILAASFETVAISGVINDTTVRDVRVAVRVLDTSCPEILAGNASALRVVLATYTILVKAAQDARKQHAQRAQGV